jgi:GPH family glycoside/pentoside/hexuronide:cation symporter
MFGSIFWWVVKLGQALAIAAGGFLLNATGFDVALGGDQSETALTALRVFDAGFPALTSALAIWVISSYGLTEEKAYAIRHQLETLRGRN